MSDLGRLLTDAFDECHAKLRHLIYRANPVLRRHDREAREACQVAFRLGRDIERRELGLPPVHSEYFVEPERARGLHSV